MTKKNTSIFDFNNNRKKTSSHDQLGNVFYFIGGNSGLTEEFIYNNQPTREDEKIEVYSGATKGKNFIGFISSKAEIKGKEIKKINTPVILVVRKGKAGKMILIRTGKICITDDAYILIPKKNWVEKIYLNWFIHQYQELFYNLVTSKSDNATFNKQYAEKQHLTIPDYNVQIKQMEKHELLYKIRKNILLIKASIGKTVSDSIINIEGKNIESLGVIFQFVGGNSELTEEFIYNNQPNFEDEKIPVYSSSTQLTNFMGYISNKARPNDKKLKIFDEPCILVSRNGYAGRMSFIPSGAFAVNDHAYVMILKDEWEKKIDLRWFVYQYQELFQNLVTSKSDNATFNKEYAEKQKVIIPTYKDQTKISRELSKLDDNIDMLNNIVGQIDGLLQAEIME